MRRLLRGLVGAVLAALSPGCLIGRVWVVDYKFQTSAFRGASGTETLLPSQPKGETDLLVTDELARFGFKVEPGRIWLSLENRSGAPFSLGIADASYSDPSGGTHAPFFLADWKLVESDAVEVPPRSKLRLQLWPKDWNHGTYEGAPAVWAGDSPLGGDTYEETTRERALAQRQRDVGKSFEIILPLIISGERVSYRFRFTVTELVAKRVWSA